MIGVIGSVALNDYVDIERTPSDYDLVGTYDDLGNLFKKMGCVRIYPIDSGKKLFAQSSTGTIYEGEIAWPDSSSEELLDLILEEGLECGDYYHADLDLLYTLKMTHRFKKDSVHFLKTMQDIHRMRKAGATIPERYQAFYERRLAETLDYSHPNLSQSKKGFFTDSVNYVYDHDTLHEAVAIGREPAYKAYQKPGSEVAVSRERFEALPAHTRLLGVYEEACVLALERSQIPYPDTDPKASFDKALEKVCTSITSGWFREYAWENYDKIQEIYKFLEPNHHYLSLFHKGLAQGIIKPHAV